VASIAELAHEEKSHTVLYSITQLIRCAGNQSFRFRKTSEGNFTQFWSQMCW